MLPLYPTHHTQILSPELADGLLAMGVHTMDDCKSKSVKDLARLPGLSKKDAQRLKDHLNKLPRFAQGDLVCARTPPVSHTTVRFTRPPHH